MHTGDPAPHDGAAEGDTPACGSVGGHGQAAGGHGRGGREREGGQPGVVGAGPPRVEGGTGGGGGARGGGGEGGERGGPNPPPRAGAPAATSQVARTRPAVARARLKRLIAVRLARKHTMPATITNRQSCSVVRQLNTR